MNRLTAYGYELDLFKELYCKLEQLEDIEEELGIDLITLFMALRKGIYVKQYGQIEHYFLKLLSDGINLYLTNYGGKRVILSQDYYGKTWALTKEKLEND